MSRPRVLYVEERTSVPSEYLLPLLTQTVDITLVTSNELIPDAKYHGVVTFPAPHFNLERAPMIWSIVRRAISKTDFDLIHCHSGLGFLMPGQIPVILQNHGSWLASWRLRARETPLARRGQLVPGFFHYVIPEYLSMRRAAKVVAVSQSLRNELVSLYGIPEERVVVIENGIDPTLVRRGAERKLNGPPQLIYVGRIAEGKGIVSFLNEFVKRPQLDVLFTVIGDGPSMDQVTRIASNDRRIRVTGYLQRDKVYEHLLNSNIFVFPSMYEGWGLALVEAMASANACVTMDIPTVKEIAGDSVITCETVVEMGRAVEQLCSSEEMRRCYQLAAADKARVWSWSLAATKIARVYAEFGR